MPRQQQTRHAATGGQERPEPPTTPWKPTDRGQTATIILLTYPCCVDAEPARIVTTSLGRASGAPFLHPSLELSPIIIGMLTTPYSQFYDNFISHQYYYS